jgi:DNA-binding transcriptional MocR family regulator
MSATDVAWKASFARRTRFTGPSEADAGELRLSYSRPSTTEITEGIRRLGALLSSTSVGR